MAKKPPQGSPPAAIRVTGNASVTLNNVHMSGFENPIQIDSGGRVNAKNVSASNRGALQKIPARKRSVGWSGAEQFDPKSAGAAGDLFEGPKLLITEGVNPQLEELSTIIARYFAGGPYHRASEIDPKTGHLVHKWKSTEDLPARPRYVAYSAINDLRNALDQAVCASAEAINARPAKAAYFPFAESPADLEGALAASKNADIPDEIKPLLRSLEPYPTSSKHQGGNDLLRSLGKIANSNKHRVPLTIAAKNLHGVYELRNFSAEKLVHHSAPKWDSENREFVIAITEADGKISYDLAMPLFVAFADSGPLDGQPVSAVLSELSSAVNGIIRGIEAETTRVLAERRS